ncbi:MAG TPA: amidohydrolase family protein, partial [Sphingomonas sp.]|nr:amidohydrolase family protein [Sphingomonas sp.]
MPRQPAITRRLFLGSAAAAAGAASAPAFAAAPIEVIDAHTHFFDPRRPEGVTWPTPDMSIYRPVLPEEFVTLTRPFNVRGAVVVEVSERLEDHDWALAMAERNPVIVAYLGRLTPGRPEFAGLLERYARNRLFRGLRTFFGTIGEGLNQPLFVEDLKRMAAAGLEIDIAGGPRQLGQAAINMAKLADRIPDLRMVINHLPMPKPEADAERALLKTGLNELRHCP